MRRDLRSSPVLGEMPVLLPGVLVLLPELAGRGSSSVIASRAPRARDRELADSPLGGRC